MTCCQRVRRETGQTQAEARGGTRRDRAERMETGQEDEEEREEEEERERERERGDVANRR